jgi:hypothetical protein
MSFISEKNKDHFFYSLLFIITVFAFWWRLINLNRLSFWSDDAFTYLAVEGILKHFYPLLVSGLIYFKQLLYSYLVSFSALIFGLNEFGLRFPSVLAGTLVIPLTYLVARQFFNNRPVALVAAFFMAFNYWSYEFSREARYYTTLQLFYLFSIYLFYRGYIADDRKFRLWTMVSFIASIFVFRLSFFLILNFFYLGIIKGIKKLFKKEVWLSFLTIVVVFGGALLFEVFFWQVGRHIKHTSSGISAIFAELLAPNANFFRQFEWLFKRMYLVFLVGIAGYLWQIVKNFPRWRWPENWSLLLFNFCVPLFLMSFGNAHYQPRYVFFLLPLFAILYARAAYWLAELATSIFPFLFPKMISKTSSLTMVAFLLIIFVTIRNSNPQKLPALGNRFDGTPLDSRFAPSTANRWHHDFKSGHLFVKNLWQPNDLVISLYAAYAYIYTGRVNFWLWTMSEENWPAFYQKNGAVFDTYTGVPVIRSLNELKKILAGRKISRIWLVSTYSLDEPGHISAEIKKFLKEENKDKIVFRNKSGDSWVWLWLPL